MKKGIFIFCFTFTAFALFFRGRAVEKELTLEQFNMLNGFGLETAKAVSALHDYKIPASVIMAQAILESGWGESKSARRFNAFFGWKAGKRWKGKTGRNADGVCRAYDSATASYIDHANNLSEYKRYSACFEIIGRNAKKRAFAWCDCLEAAGYCIDRKTYAKKLKRIIKDYDLHLHDTQPNF